MGVKCGMGFLLKCVISFLFTTKKGLLKRETGKGFIIIQSKLLRNHKGILLERTAENVIRGRKIHQTQNSQEGKGERQWACWYYIYIMIISK